MTRDADVYVTALQVDDIFADPTYQRTPPDVARARKMAANWDRRLAGILEVSDRGRDTTPRYAVMDGQHRWIAAGFLTTPPSLVANVHNGLTIEDEARLFDKLNRQRKQVNIWEHWKARRAAGDEQVIGIEKVLSKYGLEVSSNPKDGYVGCVGTLERVEKIDIALLDETLGFITSVWQTRRDGLDAPIIHGLALIFHHLRDEIDTERLVDTLLDVLPRQLKTQAVALRDMQPGSLPVLTAIVIMNLYNRKPGRKIEVIAKTFAPGKVKVEPRFVTEYRHLHDLGVSDYEIAKKLGIRLTSLVRNLERHGLPVRPELASLAVNERNAHERTAS